MAAITFAYCLGPLSVALKQPYFFAFIGTFYEATGSKAGATVMSCARCPLLRKLHPLMFDRRYHNLHGPLQRDNKRRHRITSTVCLRSRFVKQIGIRSYWLTSPAYC